MPRRKWVVMPGDAWKAVIEAEDVITGIRTFEAFKASKIHQRALERIFEIIGESLDQARKIQTDLPITNLHKIIGLRHIIAHDYYDVSIDRMEYRYR